MHEMCPECGRFTVTVDPRDGGIKRCTWLSCRHIVDGERVKAQNLKQYKLSQELEKAHGHSH